MSWAYASLNIDFIALSDLEIRLNGSGTVVRKRPGFRLRPPLPIGAIAQPASCKARNLLCSSQRLLNLLHGFFTARSSPCYKIVKKACMSWKHPSCSISINKYLYKINTCIKIWLHHGKKCLILNSSPCSSAGERI